MDHNSSPLWVSHLNSVLSVNVIKFHFNNHWLSIWIQPETCTRGRARFGAGHGSPTSTLPSPPAPKGSWSQQCLVSIEFSSILLSRGAFAMGEELTLHTSLRCYYTPKNSGRRRLF